MRRRVRLAGVASAIALTVLGLTGCAAAGASSAISVASAYVPQPTTPGSTVAYLVIRNNGAADRLVAVHTSVGGKVALRAPLGQHGGTRTMRTVPGIPIPADSMTRLNPDSYHLLITGAGPMQDGKDIMLQLTFAKAGTVTVIAMVTNPETGGGSYFLN
jgi:copper(I)-binding protein